MKAGGSPRFAIRKVAGTSSVRAAKWLRLLFESLNVLLKTVVFDQCSSDEVHCGSRGHSFEFYEPEDIHARPQGDEEVKQFNVIGYYLIEIVLVPFLPVGGLHFVSFRIPFPHDMHTPFPTETRVATFIHMFTQNRANLELLLSSSHRKGFSTLPAMHARVQNLLPGSQDPCGFW